jgi:hypothetical protein
LITIFDCFSSATERIYLGYIANFNISGISILKDLQMSIGEVTPLNVRILAIWSGIGASISLILGVVKLTLGGWTAGSVPELVVMLSSWTDGNIAMLIPALILGAFAYNVYGLLFLLLVAGTQYRFKFSEIRHPVWYWAIYPIVGIIIIGLSLIWGIFKSLDKD